ncbi:MAG: T9SS type A sorting domain-containing protein [Candidatus Kapaibacterium sp.]
MKKLILILFVWLAVVPCSAHKEWVHQYIVQEAYRYLAKQVGEIPVLRTYAGIDFNGINKPHWGPANVDVPWSLPLGISVGAWREDINDPVWRYSGGYTTISHFWSADDGDDAKTHFAGYFTEDSENAWDKARKYMFAGDRLKDLPRPFTKNTGINLDGKYRYLNIDGNWETTYAIDVAYNSLCDLLANRNSNITAFYSSGFLWESQLKQTVSFGSQRSRLLGFHVLGHILHLLADGSVPAHTHADTHICSWEYGTGNNGDTYELAMGDNLTGDCDEPHTSFHAQNWTATTAAKHGGLLLEVFSMQDEDALRYLFYTMNQLASHFGDVDDEGNDNLPNGASMLVSARYPVLGSIGVFRNDWQNGTSSATSNVINYTGDELMNYAIRVSATLMYWVAVKAGIVECPETLYQQSHTFYGVRTAAENANFKAASTIIAGRNVNPNLTSSQGDVTVESGTLTYLAGDAIQLKDGFSAKAGCAFHAKIENACPLANSCLNSTISNYDGNPTFIPQNTNSEFSEFTKKGDDPTIQVFNDTVQKFVLYIPNDAEVTTSDDTTFISDWLRTKNIRRPNDTSTGNVHLIDDPIWSYADSLIAYRSVDTVVGDTVVLSYDYPCAIYLDNVTYKIKIIKSDTSGMARNNGNDFAPRIHSIYPNPNSDYIDLQVDGMGSAATVTIYSQMGVQLSETTVGASEKLSRVSTSGLAPGMYMAVIKTAKGRTSKNFIVNR